MSFDAYVWIESVWMLVGLYWLVGALGSKPNARRETLLSRVLHITIMVAALGLLFSRSTGIWILGARFVPERTWIGWGGLFITIAGCTCAVWARVLLGRNWSAAVTVKQNHEFIRTGPYAIVRHPIYTGFLLGIVGTALALGEVRGLMALALAFVAWFRKACAEEQILVEHFGAEYVRYRREVKQLVPFVL